MVKARQLQTVFLKLMGPFASQTYNLPSPLQIGRHGPPPRKKSTFTVLHDTGDHNVSCIQSNRSLSMDNTIISFLTNSQILRDSFRSLPTPSSSTPPLSSHSCDPSQSDILGRQSVQSPFARFRSRPCSFSFLYMLMCMSFVPSACLLIHCQMNHSFVNLASNKFIMDQ